MKSICLILNVNKKILFLLVNLHSTLKSKQVLLRAPSNLRQFVFFTCVTIHSKTKQKKFEKIIIIIFEILFNICTARVLRLCIDKKKSGEKNAHEIGRVFFIFLLRPIYTNIERRNHETKKTPTTIHKCAHIHVHCSDPN